MPKLTDEEALEIEYGIPTIRTTFVAEWLRSLLADRRERIAEAGPRGEGRGARERRPVQPPDPIFCSKCRGRVYRRRVMTPEYAAVLSRYGGLKRAARAALAGEASALGKRLNELRWAKTTPEERKAFMSALRERGGGWKGRP